MQELTNPCKLYVCRGFSLSKNSICREFGVNHFVIGDVSSSTVATGIAPLPYGSRYCWGLKQNADEEQLLFFQHRYGTLYLNYADGICNERRVIL